jgi:hypothetical protein
LTLTSQNLFTSPAPSPIPAIHPLSPSIPLMAPPSKSPIGHSPMAWSFLRQEAHLQESRPNHGCKSQIHDRRPQNTCQHGARPQYSQCSHSIQNCSAARTHVWCRSMVHWQKAKGAGRNPGPSTKRGTTLDPRCVSNIPIPGTSSPQLHPPHPPPPSPNLFKSGHPYPHPPQIIADPLPPPRNVEYAIVSTPSSSAPLPVLIPLKSTNNHPPFSLPHDPSFRMHPPLPHTPVAAKAPMGRPSNHQHAASIIQSQSR